MSPKSLFITGFAILLLVLGLVLTLTPATHAATCTVTTNADSGAGSLREKIGDTTCTTIRFDNNYTIILASVLTISRTMTIDGTQHAVTLNGNHAVKVFSVNSGIRFNLNELTITGGTTLSGSMNCPQCGAGLTNTGVTTVTKSTFTDNHAPNGAAMYNAGGATLTVINSTFYNNRINPGIAGGWGDAISSDGTLYVTNSTFSDNPTAIHNWTGTATFNNSIIVGGCDPLSFLDGANNLANNGNCGPGFTNSSSILLAPFGNYGGGSWTMALLPGSAALNGTSANCPAFDQRNVGRSATCDIGAYESLGFLLAPLGSVEQSTPVNRAFTQPLGFRLYDNSGPVLPGATITFTAPSSGASIAPPLTFTRITDASGTASALVSANGIVGGPYFVNGLMRGGGGAGYQLTNISCASSSVVTSANEIGPGSLRQALENICDNGLVTFNDDYTIIFTSRHALAGNITIDGVGHRVTLSGNNQAASHFQIVSGSVVNLYNLTIANSAGNAIINRGTLNVAGSTFANNIRPGSTEYSCEGGAIRNETGGALAVINSSFSNNAACGGGAIYVYDGSATIAHSTFFGNRGTGSSLYPTGGAITNSATDPGTVTLRNSIIANSGTRGNCYGTIGGSDNLVDDATCGSGFTNSATIRLGPLANNGGSTQTFALLPGSSAINTGNAAYCLPSDQRGVTRPQGTACDIGAYEAQPNLVLSKSVTPNTTVPYQGVITYTVMLSNTGALTDTNALLTDTLPTAVTFGTWLTQPAGTIRAGNTLTWTGALTPTQTVTFIFTATRGISPRGWVTNTAYFSGSAQTGQAAAGFQVIAYAITPTAGVGGTLTPPDVQIANPGEDRVFTIAPNYGYHILDVGVDGISAGAVNAYTFTNIAADHIISATFDLNEYALTADVVGQGQITRIPDQATYLYGSIVTLTAVPEAGWHFGHWSGNASGTLTQTTVLMDANKVVTATFALNTYTITPTAGTDGTITPAEPQSVNHGSSIAFTIAPNYGYHLVDVGVDGVSVGAVNVYTFTNVTADHTLSATFDLNVYALTTGVIGQGQITRIPDQATYLHGSVVTLTAVPQPGWYFGRWSGAASGTLTQTTVLIDANKIITATFVNTPPTHYTLTLGLIGSGLITPTVGAHTYLSGTVVPLSASPAEGWKFIGWSGAVDCADGSVTMNVNKLCTATFARYQLYLPLILK